MLEMIRGGAIRTLSFLVLFLSINSFSYANDCPKWFPLPALDGLVVVVPIYDANITEPDLDCDGIIDSLDPDIDGDGVPNEEDAFPRDKTESVDTDGDGIGNNADLDDDNDGYLDADEIAYGSDPLDPNSTPAPVSNEGFKVSPLTGTSSQVAFTIALTHKPDSNVTLHYGSEDESVAKPTTSTMTFTPDTWYQEQIVRVDIFNPNSSTEIVFDPTVSDDGNYSNRRLEPVPIVSHQLLLFPPKDTIVYSEFNMSIPVSMAYVGDHEHNITVTLDTAPNGMTLDAKNGRVLWNPPVSMEGQDVTVGITVSDTQIEKTLTFDLHVAQPTLLATSVVNDKLVITDNNASLRGLRIEALDGAVLTDYRLYTLSPADTPAFSQGESVVCEALLIKGNIGKKVKVTLPLQGLVATDELLSFHTKSYFGAGNWRRVDYDYNFTGTLDQPVYELNTSSLFGVMAFTKEDDKTQNMVFKQKKVINYKALQKSTDTIHCTPQTWSFLNLTDYDNQICTFDDKPDFRLQIFNYTDAEISNSISVKDVASWVIKAQDKLTELSMPHRNYSALSFEEIDETYGHTKTTDTPGSYFVNYPQIGNYLISFIQNKLSIPKEVKITIYHEYFHQSQAAIINSTIDNSKTGWMIEASAFWFSDYVDDNSAYAYNDILTDIPSDRRIFKDGIMRSSDIASASGQGLGQGGIIHKAGYNELYNRSLFLEMIENHCINFINYIPYLFENSTTDITSLQHLSNVVNSSNCDFGSSPTGQGNESRIETAILYYQYISDIKQSDNLINSNIPVGRLGFISHHLWDIHSEDIKLLGLNDYKIIDDWSIHSIDSQSKTIRIDSLQDVLPNCQERYIRIKSEKTVLVSLASNDTNFPSTPNTMLGDMKQINFAMVGKTDFTYFYDPNTGKQIYPEMYLTIIDVVDDTENLTTQNIEVGIGLRRTNLLSHIDGKDMCAEYVPAITTTNVTADGEIPQQYRDVNDSSQYINRIKITCIESGEVFYATVGGDGTWSTDIHITFNGNQSRFTIEGYNDSDTQHIIASQGLVVVR